MDRPELHATHWEWTCAAPGAHWGVEGDVACKSRIFAMTPVDVHTIRSLFEGQVAKNASLPEEG